MIGHTVVDQERAGTIISSPGWRRPGMAGLDNAAKAKRFAEDPELTIIEDPNP
jgi:hypothetical protein